MSRRTSASWSKRGPRCTKRSQPITNSTVNIPTPPLSRRGYYKGGITQFLLNQRIDAYDSPDDKGNNREFWVEMTLKRDPSIRFLVAHSDDAPLGGGVWRDGVFIYRGGKLEPI